MNGIKIIEQNESIDKGPFYLKTEFKRFDYSHIYRSYGEFEPHYWHGASDRSQNVFYHTEMVWYRVWRNKRSRKLRFVDFIPRYIP